MESEKPPYVGINSGIINQLRSQFLNSIYV